MSRICFHAESSLYIFWTHCLNLFTNFTKVIWYVSTFRSSSMSMLFLFFILSSSLDRTFEIRWILSEWCCIFKLNWLKYYETHMSHRFSLLILIIIVKCVCLAMKVVTLWSITTIMISFLKLNLIKWHIFQTIHINSAVFIFINQ